MQVVKSVRVSLTLDDIEEHIANLTKQQLISKFKLLLDRKQIEINEKIEKNNAEHLLVLQKKMIVLEKKDDQIVKLNNALATFKNELHEEKVKNIELHDELTETKLKGAHFEKKCGEYDNIFKDEKTKRQKLKKQYEKLLLEFKILSDEHQIQVRNHRKIKDEKVLWHQQTEFLLNNLKKNHEYQIQSKIKQLKIAYETKIGDLQSRLDDERRKYESYKEKYNEGKRTNDNMKRAIELLNKQLESEKNKFKKLAETNKEMIQCEAQTDADIIEEIILSGKRKSTIYQRPNSMKAIEFFEKETQIEEIECPECKNLKNLIDNLQFEVKGLKAVSSKKGVKPRIQNVGVQVSSTPPPVLEEGSSQTIFLPLPKQQQLFLMETFRQTVVMNEKIIENWRKKYEEMQTLFLQRPARIEDREKIRELQRKLMEQQLKMMEEQTKLQNSQYLNFELRQKIAQQNSFIENVNMEAVQLKNLSKTLEPKQGSFEASFFNQTQGSSFRFGIRTKVPKIMTKTHRDRLTKYRSLSPDTSDRANTSLSAKSKPNRQNVNVYIIENGTDPDEVMDKQYQNSFNSFEKLNSILLEKGIKFRQNKKRGDKQQISEMRQYKKYKGSLKKVTF